MPPVLPQTLLSRTITTSPNLQPIRAMFHPSFAPILPLPRPANTPSHSPRRPRTQTRSPSPSPSPSHTPARACATSPQPTTQPAHAPPQQSTQPVRDLDVVITHSTADFDSLAAAVGLAKLRGPHTIVVTPGGEGPALRRFLALHRQLFRITDPRAVDPARLRWVGVVDTVRLHRLGVAADWPAQADHVVIYDHHLGRVCDITNPNKLELFVDDVGAVATLICERLRVAQHTLTPAEATLLALAIHSDTGSLTFEQTTPRDVASLAWLMQQGAIQRSIAEFTQNFLTDEQQAVLSQGLSELQRRRVHGVEIACLVLVGRTFLKGLSAVATDLLEIANVDVLILAYVNCRGRRAKKKRAMDGEFCGPEELKQVSIIGRARARVDGVDFRELFAELGGGGHARAASASVKVTEAEAETIIDELVNKVEQQIPLPRPVSEFMTTDLVTVAPSAPIGQALGLMGIHAHQILPVVDQNNVLQGLITAQDVKLAERKRGEEAFDIPVAAWIHRNVVTVAPETPFHVAEKLVADATMGMLPIVNESNTLLGVVTRMDVLIARRLIPEKMLNKQRNWV